jgi:hypothetical protein
MNSNVNQMRCLRLAVLMAWAGLATAQIAGPLTGHIFHSPTNSIRPILGVPGGAVLGGPVVRDIRFGAVSHDGHWLLIQRAESAAMVKVGNAGLEEVPLAGLLPEIDTAAWSGSGEVVIACSSTRKTLQPIRLSGGQWVADPPLDLTGLDGRLTSLSSNYAGDRIAVGLTDPERGGLYLLSGGDSLLLMPAPLPVIAMFDGAGTLYAAGSIPGAVEVFQGGVRIGSLTPASESAADAEVAGIAPTGDGKRLLVAFKDLPGLVAFDLSTGQALSEHPLDAAPNALSPISGGRWLVLTTPRKPQEPIVLVQGGEPSATYFVPVGEP